MTVADLFTEAIKYEEAKDLGEAANSYKQLLTIEPDHTAAHINIGTIYYNRKQMELAITHYKAAIASDPEYPLAHFDIANVYDEIGKEEEARIHYNFALEINPKYGDAHYNLALLLEKMLEPRKALIHWERYTKLDSDSAWAKHAQRRIKVILAGDLLKVARASINPRRTKRRARLCLVLSSSSPLSPRPPQSQSFVPLNSGA